MTRKNMNTIQIYKLSHLHKRSRVILQSVVFSLYCLFVAVLLILCGCPSFFNYHSGECGLQ